MEDKLITLAIHTPEKALIVKNSLKSMGVDSILVNIQDKYNSDSPSIAIRINESDLTKAITIIENARLFRYDDKKTYKIDDGRKRILVAIDFSSYSLYACRAAFAIAHKINAKVKILHVYKINFPLTFPFADSINTGEDGGMNMLDNARKQMLDFCYDIDKKISENDFPSVNYSYSLREGIVEEEVESFIQEYKPFLLILGTKGKSNNKQSLLGNVTADIIEMTNVPVMAIPENFNFQTFEKSIRIAYLTNFQKNDLGLFYFFVKMLTPYPNLKIILTHINIKHKDRDKLTETELTKMKQYFVEKYPEFNVDYKIIDGSNITETMVKFIEEEQINVITLNTKRRNLFGRIFLPSISRKFLTVSDVVLLVLRGESKSSVIQ